MLKILTFNLPGSFKYLIIALLLVIFSVIILACLIIASNRSVMKLSYIHDIDAIYEANKQEKNISAVEKYIENKFPMGAGLNPIINELYDDGFTVFEYKKDVYRQYPNGEYLAYNTDIFINMLFDKSYSVVYVADIRYDRNILSDKRLRIIIRSIDGTHIYNSHGVIHVIPTF